MSAFAAVPLVRARIYDMLHELITLHAVVGAFAKIALSLTKLFFSLPLLWVELASRLVREILRCLWSWVFFFVCPVPVPLLVLVCLIVDGGGFKTYVMTRTLEFLVWLHPDPFLNPYATNLLDTSVSLWRCVFGNPSAS